MRIGYFSTGFPYRDPRDDRVLAPHPYGGVQNGTYQLVKQMAKRGHDVFVFTTSANGRDTYEKYGNIHVYRYGKSFSIGSAGISLNSLYKPVFSDVNLDIIHARMGNLPLPLTGYWYSKRHDVSCVVSYHQELDASYGSLSRRTGVFLSTFICDHILSNADKIIVTSKEFAQGSKLLRKYIDNAIIIPNGVNLEEFEIPYSKEQCRENLGLPQIAKIILFVGNLSWYKAPDILIKSMKTVIDFIPDAYLVVVGDGVMKPELIELATKIGIGSSVKFAGFIVNEKSQYYKAADVFVLPSRSTESFGNVLLEASASNLPLIASDYVGVRAIIQCGYNGELVEIEDENELAHKIIYLLKNDLIRREMGSNARRNCEKFTWDAVAMETERLYLSVLGEK